MHYVSVMPIFALPNFPRLGNVILSARDTALSNTFVIDIICFKCIGFTISKLRYRSKQIVSYISVFYIKHIFRQVYLCLSERKTNYRRIFSFHAEHDSTRIREYSADLFARYRKWMYDWMATPKLFDQLLKQLS